jgi:ribosomal protein S15
MALDSAKKKEIIEKFARGEGDTGSPEVQVAVYTARIKEISGHLSTNKKDFSEHQKIENVLVSGLHAENVALVDYLERVLKINVDTADVWKNCFDF